MGMEKFFELLFGALLNEFIFSFLGALYWRNGIHHGEFFLL